MSGVLEAIMLVAFSTGWYCSIYKMMRQREARGKSLPFVLVIGFGYLCGVASKLLLWRETGVLPPIVWLYTLNALVIAVDASLVVRYTRRPGWDEVVRRASPLPRGAIPKP
ncbi:hypothetical protein [Salipiger mangrovisoli]|uniref:PQ loop repeat-containing protein n=1 Tax=Salipiger mangrovisoli TaxID=2865933 RepID=A0ABR9X1V5_9RHOB|nr:hypothetical protein [Salipiger mangrovisoli]MBE9637486.1 hypothetical protein [Salipiger mangrovisoli]